jgi:hypothetical protein
MNEYKERQKNIAKQVKEMNTTLQVLKMERDTIRKTQTEAILKMENLGKRTRSTVISITTKYKKWKRESQV